MGDDGIGCRHGLSALALALAFCSTAALALYDMVKAVDRGMTLGSLRLEEKLGGKSGVFRRAVR